MTGTATGPAIRHGLGCNGPWPFTRRAWGGGEGREDGALAAHETRGGGEPISARACIEFWLGQAAARGVAIRIPEKSHLLKIFHLVQSNTQYGFEEFHLVERR